MDNQPHFDPKKYHTYTQAEVTRVVNILKEYGVKSRQDLMEKFDVDTRSYEAIKGIGEKRSALLVWLRGQTIEDWERITGLPGFNS